MEIYGCDDLYVVLLLFVVVVGDLVFEEFEGVEVEFGLGYLEGFVENGGGFVLDE